MHIDRRGRGKTSGTILREHILLLTHSFCRYGLTLEDVRRMEAETQRMLQQIVSAALL